VNFIPVILDCDNTMGVPGCDVDDGMALLYLLGCPEVRLLGITCAYGNNTQETVYQNTKRLMKLWGREDIPVFRGADSAEDAEPSGNDASEFLAAQAEKFSGNLIVIATGSMSNLKGAAYIRQTFWEEVRMFSLMGGITEPLLVGGKPMNELNLSCDPEASLAVCRAKTDVRIATAQNSLHSFIKRKEFQEAVKRHPGALSGFLEKELEYWFRFYRRAYDLDGFVCWDVMAAAQAVHPEYFHLQVCGIHPEERSLRTGMLQGEGDRTEVRIPEIRDRRAYTRHVYERIFSAEQVLHIGG
jgi:purine nucleosidase